MFLSQEKRYEGPIFFLLPVQYNFTAVFEIKDCFEIYEIPYSEKMVTRTEQSCCHFTFSAECIFLKRFRQTTALFQDTL
jgi:hypothetical protein